MADLLQHIKKDSLRLLEEAADAVRNGFFDVAAFIMTKQLPSLGEGLQNKERISEIATKRAGKKRRAASETPILDDNQIRILDYLLYEKISFSDVVKKEYPELANTTNVGSTSKYQIIRSRLKLAMRKIKLVFDGQFAVKLLPDSNKQFYRELKEKFPEKKFFDLCEIINFYDATIMPVRTGRTGKKRKQNVGKEAAEEQKPFR